MPNLVALIPAAFVIALVPGPATVMLIKQSARGSRRNSLATIAGIEAGVLFWGLAAVFGLSALLVASQTAYDILRLAGAAFLIYLGVRALFFSRADPAADEVIRPGSGFRSGFLINVSNPKAGIFAISFLPQFVPTDAGPLPLLLCVLIWMAVDTVWYTTLALVFTRLGQWLRGVTVRRRLERTSGGVLVAFGVTVALEG